MKNGLDGRFGEKPGIIVPFCNMPETLLDKELKVVRAPPRVSHFQDEALVTVGDLDVEDILASFERNTGLAKAGKKAAQQKSKTAVFPQGPLCPAVVVCSIRFLRASALLNLIQNPDKVCSIPLPEGGAELIVLFNTHCGLKPAYKHVGKDGVHFPVGNDKACSVVLT